VPVALQTGPLAPRRFVFISTNEWAAWGGSEELWVAAATRLAEQRHRVTVYKPHIDDAQPRIRRLRELACSVDDLARPPLLPHAVSRIQLRLLMRLGSPSPVRRVWFYLARHWGHIRRRLNRLLPPVDLVIVSQAGNHDGAGIGDVCRRLGLPFVLIAQKATDLRWPSDDGLSRLRAVYGAAAACYFVSKHNRCLTEEQLGCELPRAEVIRNPFLVPWELRSDWPDEQRDTRLACVGRLCPADKGQDLLLRVLARQKWRGRRLRVTFFGEGPQRSGLERLAAYLRLTSVTFRGFVADVASIWDDHHGLILPSRAEGLPLVLVEAMLSGRVPIVTDVAGNGEVLEDGETGFLACAPTEEALDEAMERAWQRRAEWRAIGAAAAASIRTLVTPDPGQTLAEKLLRLAG
jgi:glycosyltransferase involved in cell wall biosynthesis